MEKTKNYEKTEEQGLKPGMHPSFLNILREKQEIKQKLAGIKHRIGVYSAKGGVGKTTVAVNLAYELSMMHFKVGLLDADIDCPNVTFFTGIGEVIPQQYPLKPVEKNGVKVISTAMLIEDKEKPIIWRGPMKSKMLREFFENTTWGDLDYLIIDLPPGSSDVPLSLMQLLELDGILLVTTPQDIAAKNTIKSGFMAKSMNVAILGIVETMSMHGRHAGADKVAKTLGSDVLGAIEYDEKFNAMSDAGKVPVLEDVHMESEFRRIAEKIAVR